MFLNFDPFARARANNARGDAERSTPAKGKPEYWVAPSRSGATAGGWIRLTG
jgi:hypothetical protein